MSNSDDPNPIEPRHYKSLSLEPIVVIEAWGLGFCDGNAVKYIARWRAKGGVQDLEKALWYLTRFVQQEKEKAKQLDPEISTLERDTQ